MVCGAFWSQMSLSRQGVRSWPCGRRAGASPVGAIEAEEGGTAHLSFGLSRVGAGVQRVGDSATRGANS